MVRTYVTFGQDHAHSVNGRTFDKDSVAIVEAPTYPECHAKVQEFFGLKYCTDYPEKYWDVSSVKFYPRGYIFVEGEQ